MKQNPQKSKTDRLLSTAETVLLVLVILFFLLPVLFFGWYGSTYIPVTQKSEIHSRELVISRGSSQCTLDIPAGELTIRRLQRAVIGSSYRFEANVRLDRPCVSSTAREPSPTGTSALKHKPHWSAPT